MNFWFWFCSAIISKNCVLGIFLWRNYFAIVVYHSWEIKQKHEEDAATQLQVLACNGENVQTNLKLEKRLDGNFVSTLESCFIFIPYCGREL